MKMLELRKKTVSELTNDVNKLREEIAEATRRLRMGEVQNVRVVRGKRKDLARMLTIIGEQLREETK